MSDLGAYQRTPDNHPTDSMPYRVGGGTYPLDESRVSDALISPEAPHPRYYPAIDLAYWQPPGAINNLAIMRPARSNVGQQAPQSVTNEQRSSQQRAIPLDIFAGVGADLLPYTPG